MIHVCYRRKLIVCGLWKSNTLCMLLFPEAVSDSVTVRLAVNHSSDSLSDCDFTLQGVKHSCQSSVT